MGFQSIYDFTDTEQFELKAQVKIICWLEPTQPSN